MNNKVVEIMRDGSLGAFYEHGERDDVIGMEFAAPLLGFFECQPKVSSGWTYDPATGIFSPPETPPLPTLEEAKTAKYAEIANARWQSETGGTTLNGIEIATDRESQAMITGAALQAVVDPNYTCRWKTVQGFISISAAEIVGIAQAVRAHVQACFDREAALLSAIDAAETVEAVLAVAWEA